MLWNIDLEIQRNLTHLGAYDMLQELKAMFSKQAEQELLQTVREFHTCKQEEGQSVSTHVLKMKGYIDNLERLCQPVGKNLATVNELHAMLKLHEDTLPKKDANPALRAIRAGFRKTRKINLIKLLKGVMGLRGSNGNRAAVEAIGSYHLELPTGLVIVLNNCHYAPSITRGVISVSRLYDDSFINRFDENNVLSVSKNNLFYFVVVPRDGIFEIDIGYGFTQTYGVNYEETFSPVADIRAIRILIAIAAYYDYEIWQMDVKTAFLNGHLSEEVYMEQPEGFVNPKYPNHNPGEEHWTAVKNILKYLRNTKDMFLVLIGWKSTKQSIFATSSTDAEYIAAFDASKEAVWIRKFISGLGIVPTIEEPISMYCDNTRAIAIAKDDGVTKGVRLNESRCFTVSAMRKHIESFTLSTDAEKIRWNNLIPIKLNILTWRISLDRIPTRSNLDSRGIDLDSISCPVCNDEIETSQHLLIDCSIAKSSWILVSKWWGFHDYPKDLPSLIKWADNTNLPTKSARIFDAVVQTTLWAIWNLRNRICFDSKPPRKDLIGNDIKLLSHLWISHRSRNCKPCWLNWTSDPAIACSYL
ncbi:zinc finger, CCHC-type containing protein [Tanacetum coccineum]|uniref:Zinc finger, CCHC-type containing protein n=1 Tax=Tanacetum coccineum TaxID=301880 RepID=A0ABQ4XX39_9ASTR